MKKSVLIVQNIDELDDFSDELDNSFTEIPPHYLPGQLESETDSPSQSPSRSPLKKTMRRDSSE